jgi:hypothetical protein
MRKTMFFMFIPLVSWFVFPPCKPVVAGENPVRSLRPFAETEWKLSWEDDFSADQLDTSKWSRCQRGRPAWRDTMSDDPRLLQINDGVLQLRGITNDKKANPDDPAPYLTGAISVRQ